jgi:hypothetical protein
MVDLPTPICPPIPACSDGLTLKGRLRRLTVMLCTLHDPIANENSRLMTFEW